MKVSYLLSNSARALAVTLLALAGLTTTQTFAASSGELDPSFDPVASEIPAYPVVFTVGRDVYLQGYTNGLFRFRENGRLDPSWSLFVPAKSSQLGAVAPTPFGGWVVSDYLNTYIDHGDGSYERVSISYAIWNGLFPQDDGSILANGGFALPTPYPAIPTFYDRNTLSPVAFGDGAGTGEAGGKVLAVQVDSRGRSIIGGTFNHCGDYERFGLARLLPDGTPDASWNPALQLGLGQPGGAALKGIPDGFYPGPSNSVVATLLYVSTNGVRNRWIATIDENGTILGSFAAPSLGLYPLICVQPDHRILVAGTFTNWSGQPVTGLIRLNVDGSVDPGFQVQLTGSKPSNGFWGLALDGSGRLVIAGYFDSVNGVARPGVARVFVYDPAPQAPSVAVSFSQPGAATNEVLYLTATVDGFPAPNLQWYRNGLPIPGATSRGLRIVVGGPGDVGAFRLVATSTNGSAGVDFPSAALLVRSPVPGATNTLVYWPDNSLPTVRHLVPLPDGRVLAGCGVRTTFYTNSVRVDVFTNSAPMVACFLKDGSLDPQFGNGGTVSGNGYVDSLRVLPNGHILVAGGFTKLAGSPASGLAELDASGTLVPRSFPALEPVPASSILPLPSGGYVVSGLFTNVGGADAFRLVKLTAALAVDPSFHSHLKAWQFVDDMELDPQGKVLIGGARIYTDVVLTNPVPTGLQRLLPDGSPDPAFTVFSGGVSSIFVEPSGTILIGPPFSRLATNGQVLQPFERYLPGLPFSPAFDPDHTAVRLPDGSGVLRAYGADISTRQLLRWSAAGSLDHQFAANFDRAIIEATAALADGSILVSKWSTSPFATGPRRQLVVIPPDPDSRLIVPRRVGGNMVVDLATQPGRHYEIRRLTDLASGTSTPVAVIDGDGYVQHISTPADASTVFMTLKRR